MYVITKLFIKNIEVKHSVLVIVYIFTEKISDPETDMNCCVQNLFNVAEEENEKPNVLWSFYYSTPNVMEADLRNGVPQNVFLCSGPDLDLDYDEAIKKVTYTNTVVK